MLHLYKTNYKLLVAIIALAAWLRIRGVDFSNYHDVEKGSLIFSILAGIAAVTGLYVLAKEMFGRQIAGVASFLMAISYWHIAVSQLNTLESGIIALMIFSFYSLWLGIKYGRILSFAFSGFFLGSLFYAGRPALFAPLVAVAVLWNYWDYIKSDFAHSKYMDAKHRFLQGTALLMITAVLVALPVLFHTWLNPETVFNSAGTVFAAQAPWPLFWENLRWIAESLLFVDFQNGSGVYLSWLMVFFFAIGFIKEMSHWLKQRHGHFSIVHTLMFAWLFIMILPAALGGDGEPSLVALSLIIPPVMMISAHGVWWLVDKINRWSHVAAHTRLIPHRHYAGSLDAGPFLALLSLLLAITVLEVSKLF